MAGLLTLAAHGSARGGAENGPVVVPLAPALPGPVATTNAIAAPAVGPDPVAPKEAEVAPVALLVDLGGRFMRAMPRCRFCLPRSPRL